LGERPSPILRRRWEAIAVASAPGLIRVAITATALGVATTSPNAATDQKVDLSSKAVVASATRYVADYQQRFAFLVADETYHQTSAPPGRQPFERLARGEMFLTYLESDRMWTVVHDISEVDGQPVPNHESLRALLMTSSGSLRSIARRVFDENARYNIGGIRRNFNDPMLALQLFSERYRSNVQFDVERTEVRDGRTLATLSFRERDRPTIVSGPDGTAFPARGEIVLDAVSGEIRRAQFSVKNKGTGADLETMFERDDRLALWVPIRFTERYTKELGRTVDVTSCDSTYTNYRRFEVRGRIGGGIGGK
jgi:hypothetical protein